MVFAPLLRLPRSGRRNKAEHTMSTCFNKTELALPLMQFYARLPSTDLPPNNLFHAVNCVGTCPMPGATSATTRGDRLVCLSELKISHPPIIVTSVHFHLIIMSTGKGNSVMAGQRCGPKQREEGEGVLSYKGALGAVHTQFI